MNILCEVSIGEIFDKLSILEIKLENITDPEKLKNISHEKNFVPFRSFLYVFRFLLAG